MPKFRWLLFIIFFSYPALANESASSRGKKSVSLLAETGLTLVPTTGIRLGLILSKNVTLEINGANAKSRMTTWERFPDGSESEKWSLNYSKNIYSTKLKVFFGNSSYIDFGPAIEQWKIDYEVMSIQSATIETLKARIENTGIEFHFGNQWQWDYFTLGCDWIGGFYSLKEKIDFPEDGANIDSADKGSKEQKLRSWFSGESLHLLRIYLGFSF